MAHLKDIPAQARTSIEKLPCPTFGETPFAAGPTLDRRRVALISTAGLNQRDDRVFSPGSKGYRKIPGETAANDMLMSHVSVN